VVFQVSSDGGGEGVVDVEPAGGADEGLHGPRLGPGDVVGLFGASASGAFMS
ncbi:hypothetical protein Tco_0636501, partial [Tanacetum coccineum]